MGTGKFIAGGSSRFLLQKLGWATWLVCRLYLWEVNTQGSSTVLICFFLAISDSACIVVYRVSSESQLIHYLHHCCPE